MKILNLTLLVASLSLSGDFLAGGSVSHAADQQMSFFVTSVGGGDGANLGGLEGADAHCTSLATAAGARARQWRAYLSTEENGKRGVSARDRIGSGPWYNARGELIAVDVDQLHLNPNIVKRTAIDENGNPVKGRGDKPNEHDLLTGSMADGTASLTTVTTHVRAGRATATAAPRSVIMTATAAAIRPGIRPTPAVAAVRTIFAAPAVRACSCVSPLTDLGSVHVK